MYVPELMPRDPPEPGGPCRRLDDSLQQPGRVARASPGRREDQVRWPDRERHAAMTAQQGQAKGPNGTVNLMRSAPFFVSKPTVGAGSGGAGHRIPDLKHPAFQQSVVDGT